jgi:hypothetical protein
MMIASEGIAEENPSSPKPVVVWNLDNLKQIGAHAVQVFGEPRVIESDGVKAIQFDGKDDGIFLDVHPLAGAKEFTAEVVFRPDAGGPAEQRFFHMQENGSENRVMFETRLTKDGEWFLDTHIQSGEAGFTLFAEKHRHPVGRWYHAALVVDGKEMRHYVDGKLEMTTPITYRPQGPGKTSLGVRQNKVFWFQGAIRTARFTHSALAPEGFLKRSK